MVMNSITNLVATKTATNERAIIRVVIATGISSVVTQLLLIREFLAQFQGNEFVIALILFNWLILGGMGTLLARLVTRRGKTPSVAKLAWLSFLLIAISPLMILAIRILRDIFFIHGTSVGFYPTFAYSFFTIMPFGLLLGFLLPYSLFVLRVDNKDYPGTFVYMADNLGDVAGGAIFSFTLVHLVSPMQAVFFANLLLLFFAWRLFPSEKRFRPAVLAGTMMSLLALIAGIFLEKPSLVPMKGKLVHYRESRYGRITVVQDQEQYTLFNDGSPTFSTQNVSMAEQAIHYPLAQIENPKNILLISAVGGMLAELAKHQPESIDYLELDPEMTTVEFHYGLLKNIPNLNVIHQDGRAWLNQTLKTYDAIIVNLPEPETFQINRFYTDRFFALAKDRLKPDGIFSFSMEGYDNYLGEPQRRKLSVLYTTVKEYFNHVLLLPGETIYFLCSAKPLSVDIPQKLIEKGISTYYISGFYYGNVTTERITQLNDLMDTSSPKNSDLNPNLMRIMFSQWFAKFSTSPITFVSALVLLLAIYMTRITREEFVLFSTGAMTMGCEILVIFAFQIFFGYIYLQIGLIVTVFLAGLLPGAWLGDKWSSRGRQILLSTDILLIAMLGIFLLMVYLVGDGLPVIFFLLFGFIVSLACGCQFPVALFLRGGDNPAATRVFSADLIGAACGTLLTSVVLIPYLGIIWATICLIGLKTISLLLVGTANETM